MKKFLMYLFSGIIPLFYLCCFSNGGQLEELRREFLMNKLRSMQLTASKFIENRNELEVWNSAEAPKDMPIFAYAMVLLPDGKMIAHSEPPKAIGILKDEVTIKVLAYQDKCFVKSGHGADLLYCISII